ncbi:EamA family transporter RarD [Roseateles saccharophilus]|uniref:Chloramphenicol-sensitive protein RarD n=1 Tax=Roseateles saccharophilus TaxID=304 RepID=A0A4R3V515_ROSSA|nr:EamA family transporter RarD [Roseateles saccharophilus]MDG0831444.1 EamA family transporter RarD [Roseateles saccharophilus]TCU98672.1 chloramphenicol-sensitive protein RarD [Roseateles saccharophilus]
MNRGIFYALGAYLSWGLFPLYFRQIAAVPALQIVAHRTLWSLVFVAVVMLTTGRLAWLKSVSLATWRRFALSAALIAVNWLTYVWAVGHGQVINASLGYFINPLVNVALGFAVLHERPRPVQWLAVGLAALGVLWLTLAAGTLPWVALVLALSFGLYGLMRKTAALGALEGLALETLILAPLAVAGLAWWWQAGDLAGQTTTDWAWLIGTGPVTAGALLLFAAGARRIPLATLGIVQYASPSLQFLLGVFLFHEPMDANRLVAFACIWGALAVYSAEGLWQTRRALTVRPI